MILLDTTICIHVINARPQAVLERFRHYRMGEIGLCSVVAAELAYGTDLLSLRAFSTFAVQCRYDDEPEELSLDRAAWCTGLKR